MNLVISLLRIISLIQHLIAKVQHNFKMAVVNFLNAVWHWNGCEVKCVPLLCSNECYIHLYSGGLGKVYYDLFEP